MPIVDKYLPTLPGPSRGGTIPAHLPQSGKPTQTPQTPKGSKEANNFSQPDWANTVWRIASELQLRSLAPDCGEWIGQWRRACLHLFAEAGSSGFSQKKHGIPSLLVIPSSAYSHLRANPSFKSAAMAEIQYSESLVQGLRGKVVVLTGKTP